MVDLKTTLSMGADYDKWIKADLWTVERAILLLIDAESLPYWPNNYDTCSPITDDEKIIYSDFMDIWDIARASLKAGSLNKVDKSAAGVMRNEVRPNEFIHWARTKGYEIPDNLKTIRAEPLAEPLADAGAVGDVEPKTNPTLTKLKKQQAAILKSIAAKGLKPMAIPDGEKATIKRICELEHSELFKAETAFDRAWKDGVNTLWRMDNHESYAHRGK